MNAADCLLLTSSIEGSPNVVKESLMCDLPVIATQVGDVHELLSGVTPSWVCQSHPADLAAALVECLSSPTRSNGRERFGWVTSQVIAGRILGLYAALAPGSIEGVEQIGAPCAA